jgi:hypothetical protein
VLKNTALCPVSAHSLSLFLSLSSLSSLRSSAPSAHSQARRSSDSSHPEKSSSAPRRRREERQVHALSREQWMHRHPHRCNSRTFVLCELSAARPVAETPFLNPRRCAASPRRWSRPEPRTMFALAPRGPPAICVFGPAGWTPHNIRSDSQTAITVWIFMPNLPLQARLS